MHRSLDFNFSPLERNDGQNVDNMLDYIVDRRRDYNKFSDTVKDRCREFTKIMAVNFVYQSNKANVGTQTFDETRELLDGYLESNEHPDSRLNETDRRAVNILCALRESFHQPTSPDYHKSALSELREHGLVTVSMVCQLHAILLKGFAKEDEYAGTIRRRTGTASGEVYTQRSDDEPVHFYPLPEGLDDKFHNVVERHSIHVKNIQKQANREDTTYIFKCAAWLLYEIVALHPFYDGNGRICRLLANHVLSLITPFPVTIYHKNSPDRNRDHYIQAIIHCQENSDKGPGKLATMLVEGAYIGWKELFRYLKSGDLLGIPLLGPIVVQQSDMDNIPNKVKRLCHSRCISEEDEKKMLTSVLEAVKSADTTNITDADQHLRTIIELIGMNVQIDIYP